MYVQSLRIRNVRSIEDLQWEVPSGHEAGWHVILGDNGAGKSTFLRALALALLGPREATGLRQDWSGWVTRGQFHSVVEVEVIRDVRDEFIDSNGVGPSHLRSRTSIRRSGRTSVLGPSRSSGAYQRALSEMPKGWFSASYGPFRRFSGGDVDSASLSLHQPRLAAHLSLFGENFALTEALRWLQDLDYRRKDSKPEGKLLDRLIAFVNDSALLPHDTRLRDVNSDGVTFEDGNGCEVPVLELSDGYRSILSLMFELVRQLAISFGPDAVFDKSDPHRITLPGVVLIDEVDAHLHPTWQHRIGDWFMDYFPNMQFIVTTHSPIVCQAAVRGSIWRLPVPGSDEIARRLEGTELDRLLYGNILDAYSTGVFGEGVTRSEAGKERLQQLAELNITSLERDLTAKEQGQREALRASTPTASSVALETGIRVP